MIARRLVKEYKLLSNLRANNYLIKRNASNEPSNVSNVQIGTPTYDGDGKTNAQIINKDIENGILINAISKLGFRLNTDLFVVGPMIIFPRTLFSWNIERIEDVNEKSLCMFALLDPKIDILVLGTGDHHTTPDFQKKVLGFIKKYNVNVEVMPTENACATYNFLAAEGRMVAAALIPPKTLNVSEDDYAKYMIDRQNILELA